MVATRTSRRSAHLRSRNLLPWLAAGLLACSGGSGEPRRLGGTNQPTNHPPSLSNLSLYPPSAAVNDGAGSVSVSFSANVFDAGADVSRVAATVLDSTGAQVSRFEGDITNPPGMTSGALGGQVPISTAAIATYTLQFQAFDSGGSGSNVLQTTFAVTQGNPVPTISSLSPSSATAGGPSFKLVVTGSGFVSTSSVLWNGNFRSTNYVDETTLEVQVESWDIYWAGTAQITVSNPWPGGGTSLPLTFTIDPPPPNPTPTLTSISPTSADAGGPSFTLTVTGSGFVASSSVLWNGSHLSTTFVDATTLSASVPAERLASVGTASISVQSPWPGGGTSSTATFTVTMPSQPGVTLVGVAANDLVWDPYQRKIYLSVPSASPLHPNTITELDPFTGQLGASQFAGSEPGTLALSDDGQYLYVGLGGASSVNRFVLPGLAPDVEIPLGRDATYGPYYAGDLQVAPGAPRAVAVSLGVRGYSWSANAVAVFDDATQRPTKLPATRGSFDSLQWGATASTLYAAAPQYWGDLFVLSVDASGVALTKDYAGAFDGYAVRIHFDPGTGLVYGDDGRAVDPATGLAKGTFSTTGLYASVMVPDSSLDSGFFLGAPSSWGSSSLTIRAYHLRQYFETRSTTVAFVSGPTSRLIRWGPDGLAFRSANQVVLVRGTTVLPVSTDANPTPEVTSLAPASAAAGAGNFRLAVTGSGFVPGSIVRWNGSDRTTRFVSATEVVAFIPASDVSAAGSSQVVVASPSPGGGTSGPVAFTVAP